MLKKFLIATLALIILSLCCTICFAKEDENKINLGNEIMRSIDKTENSMQNVISGNVVNDTGNIVRDGINGVENGTRNVGNTVNDYMNNGGNINNDNINNNNNTATTGLNNGNYNTARTSVDQTLNGGINTMTATTWMWIILIVAAVTIIAAIWYYATQDNK